MAQYVVIIRKAPGTDYWVDAPDIPGCISRGTTTDEARKNFAEALLFHFDRHSPDDIQIRGNLTTDPPPIERHPVCSHPVT